MPIIGIYALIAAVIFSAGAGVSWKFTSDHYEAKAAKDDRVALEDFKTAVQGMNALSKELEDQKNETRVVYKTIEKQIPKIVERPVYRNECIDDRGLLLVNEALSGRLDSAEHVKRLPGDTAP